MIDGPPALFTTENVIHLDPWCTSVKYALENCILSDSMHKYEPSLSFTFTKTWKRRYVVLVDRVVFIFKTSKSTSPPKEHFTLTDDTFVFVTEEFKKGYVIELRKPSVRWYIRCDSITQMKSWLESMKKVVACIKIGFDGVLSSTMLSSISLSEDYRIIIHQPITMNPHRKSLPPINTLNTRYPIPHVSTVSSSSSVKRQSLAEIPDWEASIPPQLPPPTSKLPAVPPLFAVSE
ncbi:hypothetical protein BDB01DRAFT_805819 [Pilobolus umbonatus]|nr:hypothetical protein BDB01DRAFT_805819 [Pilobolus umbonatus]